MLESIAQALEPLGLLLRGGMHVAPGDKVPALPDGRAGQTLLLVGNAGPALWRAFSAAPEYADGQAHPLNRWTRRQLDAVAIVGMQCLRQSPNRPIAGQIPLLKPEFFRQCRLDETQRHRG